MFDSKGQCKPAAISVLSAVASDCWGTFFIVWDLVKTARKFVAPFHECVILHGPGEHYSAREDEFHAQFLGGLLRTVNSNRLRMIKIVSEIPPKKTCHSCPLSCGLLR